MGNSQVFPNIIQQAEVLSVPVLAIPVLIILILMVFWLIRVLLTNTYKTSQKVAYEAIS